MNVDTKWRAVETTWDPWRKEWNLLVRRPFYANLRLGLTQCALWVGEESKYVPRQIFNFCPKLVRREG